MSPACQGWTCCVVLEAVLGQHSKEETTELNVAVGQVREARKLSWAQILE